MVKDKEIGKVTVTPAFAGHTGVFWVWGARCRMLGESGINAKKLEWRSASARN